jgi:hypothetical protein
MKKKTVRKMTLTKETLRDLAGTALHEAVGGSHNFSHCNPTLCPSICPTRCASDCEICESLRIC